MKSAQYCVPANDAVENRARFITRGGDHHRGIFPVWMDASVFSVGRAHHLFRSHPVESCLGESRLLPSTVRTSVGPTARAPRRSAPSRPREIDATTLGKQQASCGQNARASGQTDSRPCSRSPAVLMPRRCARLFLRIA
jgi:hypothetical protein